MNESQYKTNGKKRIAMQTKQKGTNRNVKQTEMNESQYKPNGKERITILTKRKGTNHYTYQTERNETQCETKLKRTNHNTKQTEQKERIVMQPKLIYIQNGNERITLPTKRKRIKM